MHLIHGGMISRIKCGLNGMQINDANGPNFCIVFFVMYTVFGSRPTCTFYIFFCLTHVYISMYSLNEVILVVYSLNGLMLAHHTTPSCSSLIVLKLFNFRWKHPDHVQEPQNIFGRMRRTESSWRVWSNVFSPGIGELITRLSDLDS